LVHLPPLKTKPFIILIELCEVSKDLMGEGGGDIFATWLKGKIVTSVYST